MLRDLGLRSDPDPENDFEKDEETQPESERRDGEPTEDKTSGLTSSGRTPWPPLTRP